MLRRVEDVYALLAGPTELESAENSETFSSRQYNMSASSTRTRHDKKGIWYIEVTFWEPKLYSNVLFRKNLSLREEKFARNLAAVSYNPWKINWQGN